MIALSTNLLVYAHREDSPWHETADARLAVDPGGGPRPLGYPLALLA